MVVEVRARAPGKIILSGEHAVVHGATAVAAAIDLYTHVSICPSAVVNPPPSNPSSEISDAAISIELKDLALLFSWKIKRLEEVLPKFHPHPSLPQPCLPDDLVSITTLVEEQNVPEALIWISSGLSVFLYLYMSIQGFIPARVVLSSTLPMGAGLGSSASFCVSLSAALLLLSDAVSADRRQTGWLKPGDNDLELINKWAFEGEKIIHGKPSGVDNTVITFGNMIEFRPGELTHIKCGSPVSMLVTNTKVGRNTKALVAGVCQRAKLHPQAMSAVFTAADIISKELSNTIQAPASDDLSVTEKEEKLERLMEMSQGLLQCMGVSHSSIETVLRTTLKYKLVSKLTGAGGGGCVLTLLPNSLSRLVVDKVIGELESYGFQCFIAEDLEGSINGDWTSRNVAAITIQMADSRFRNSCRELLATPAVNCFFFEVILLLLLLIPSF